VAGSVLTALGLLLAPDHDARAQSDCQVALERWAKLSNTRVVPKGVHERGACLQAETVRSDLLDALARVRGICADGAPDQVQQQARALLNINQDFISSLAICSSITERADGGAGGSSSGGGGDGWVTKSAPSAPTLAAPAGPPLTGGPRPSVISPAPGSATVPSPPCLEISPGQSGGFSLVNRRCQGHAVLVVVETRGGGGETSCRGYEIRQSLALAASEGAAPKVNFECVAGGGPCNKDRLGDMFPECDW
jgi:hypothetical protein